MDFASVQEKMAKAHDHFFQYALAEKKVLLPFLQTNLPKLYLEDICVQEVSQVLTQHVNQSLKLSINDVIFETTLKENNKSVYLFLEHQSHPEKLMPLRMLEYMHGFFRYHRRIHQANELPVVIPMLVYNGVKAYPYSDSVQALFVKSWMKNFIQCQFL